LALVLAIGRSIRITKSCLTTWFAGFRLRDCPRLSRHESSPRPAEPGMEGSAMPYLRAIRQPRLRWIVPADHVIPPAAQLAMAQHAQAHIVKVDASHLSMVSHPQR
jgi:hypothetical protein